MLSSLRMTCNDEMPQRISPRARGNNFTNTPRTSGMSESRGYTCLCLFVLWLRTDTRQTLIFSNLTNPATIKSTQQTLSRWPLVPQSTSSQHQAVIVQFLMYLLPTHPCLEASSSLPLPAVLTAPIRLDVVQQVHSTSNS